MKITGAEAIIKSLLAEKVEALFGYPGGMIMPVYDALYKMRHRINHILVRHEQGAAHAAEGYSWITGKTGVCLVTSGPGATNLVTGITDAMIDSIPLVCISGQVPANMLGNNAFQEANIIGITDPITKWNYQITSASEIPEVMAKAFYIASTGRPGPVMIDITKNAQFETFDFKYPETREIPNLKPNFSPDIHQIKDAAKLLNHAKRPYMLVGHGVIISKAEKEALKISEKAGIPVACTHLGLSAIPSDYQLYVGILGMHGNYGPNILTNQADVILAVGLRFNDRVTGRLADYAKQARIIHIDIDPAELNKNVKAAIPVIADAKAALSELYKYLKPKKHPHWFEEFKKYAQIEYQKVIKENIHPQTGEIKMGEVVKMLSDKTNGQAVIVADVGQNQMASMRYYDYKTTNGHITSGGLGTMGFALPAAIGAKIGRPEKEVFAIVGDGSFQMTIQELGTIYQEKLPVKIIILNNNYLGMVRQWQQLFFEKRYSFVDLVNPDFVNIAKSYYIPGQRIEKREDLNRAVDSLIKSKGPYLLEVAVEKEQNIFPMIPPGASVEEILLG